MAAQRPRRPSPGTNPSSSGQRGRPRFDAQSDRGTPARRRGADGPSAREGLQVPGGAREPIGRDRASRTSGAPPRPGATAAPPPPRPDLPTGERPQLPGGVLKEIERLLGKTAKSRDVALALSIGSAAIDEQRVDVALEVLSWAKYEAPKLAPIREAYGVALYLDEQFAESLTELQAYRRLTGRSDQNHLVADSLRALGRDTDKIATLAEELVADERAPEDRRAEAVIVWAAALADSGELGAARAVVRRFLERARSRDAEHDLRVRILAADLAERAGDVTELARQLELVVAVDPGFLDAADRLAEVRDETD